VTTATPYSSSARTSAPSPAAVIAAAIAGACRELVSTSSTPPGASQSGAADATRRSTASPSEPPSSAISASCSRASAGMNVTSPLGTYGALQISTSARPRSEPGSAANRSPAYTRPPAGSTFRRAHATATGSSSAACSSPAPSADRTASPSAPVPQHRSTINGAGPASDTATDTATDTRNSLRRRGTNTPGSTRMRKPPNDAQPTTCSSGSPATRRATIASSEAGDPAAETSSSASSSAKTQPPARSRATTV